jgi:hypothetical protein
MVVPPYFPAQGFVQPVCAGAHDVIADDFTGDCDKETL